MKNAEPLTGQSGISGQNKKPHHSTSGLTVADVARRYRVSEDKVRAWIDRGELIGINTAAVLSGRPRWVITREALEAFEKARRGGPTPKPKRRRREPSLVDYFPD